MTRDAHSDLDMLEFIARRSVEDLRQQFADPEAIDVASIARLGALSGIATLHTPSIPTTEAEFHNAHCEICSTPFPCDTVRWIAAAWRSHENYDKAWLPPVPKTTTTSK